MLSRNVIRGLAMQDHAHTHAHLHDPVAGSDNWPVASLMLTGIGGRLAGGLAVSAILWSCLWLIVR
jgi:hypothetical protein